VNLKLRLILRICDSDEYVTNKILHMPTSAMSVVVARFKLFHVSFLANVRYMLSPVHLSSVTFVRPTQAVQIFGNISTALGTLAIH